MDENQMIQDIIAQLDAGMGSGTGHVNIDIKEGIEGKQVDTMGCPDCSTNKFACAIPTLDDGSDDLPIE